jgi:drug efflux transport system permease protein
VDTVLPSVLLSGYTFLINTMPPFFRGVSRLIPATYYIQILRGVILRGAGFTDLWLNALVLTLMGYTTVLLAARQFVNQRGR